MRFGYGTNGFANHRLDDALAVIADLGYTGVALTLDHHHLDPYGENLAGEVRRVAARLDELGLSTVIETGARYLLDPRRKHHPTLVSADTAPRVDFLKRAVRIAEELGSDCVSFWSGVAEDGLPAELAWDRMRRGLDPVLAEAAERGVRLACEPEPGMVVQHVTEALRLREDLGAPDLLGITLDVGHCVAVEPVSAAECARLAGPLLFNVQLDDMRHGVHEHLEFGEGELDLAETLGALAEIGYTGLAAVELPRHSHAAPQVAERCIAALRAASPENAWLTAQVAAIEADPAAIRTAFPAVGREIGRGPLRADRDPDGLVHGTVDDAARGKLLAALGSVLDGDDLAKEVRELYRYGDDAERRGVLRGLHLLPEPDKNTVDTGLELVADALRSNDTRLVAAALGPFAEARLDQRSWRHGVLKCLFMGVPLTAVSGLGRRRDAELSRMAADYAAERKAAGRAVPADADLILEGGA